MRELVQVSVDGWNRCVRKPMLFWFVRFVRTKDLVMQQLSGVNQRRKLFRTIGLASLVLFASGFRDAGAVAPQPAGAQCQVQAGNGVWSPLLATCQAGGGDLAPVLHLCAASESSRVLRHSLSPNNRLRGRYQFVLVSL